MYLEVRNILKFYFAPDYLELPYCKQTVQQFFTGVFSIRPSVTDGVTRVRYNDTTGLR